MSTSSTPSVSTPSDVAKPDATDAANQTLDHFTRHASQHDDQHSIDALTLQYPDPASPDPPPSLPSRPVITIITTSPRPRRSMSPQPDSASSIPFVGSSVSDTSPLSYDSPNLNTPMDQHFGVAHTAVSDYVPHIYRRDTNSENNIFCPRRSLPIFTPPAIPSLLPDTMPLSRTSSISSVASSWSAGSVPASSSLPIINPAPYLHPHTQSYAALASASSSSCSPTVASQPYMSRKRGASDIPDPSRSSPTTAKRRKMWVHALEKNVFTPEEIASLPAPTRRTIYTSSLEAHIDKLHNQLLTIGLWPIPFEKLDPYHGLNSKTAKSMVAGLHRDMTTIQTRLAALQRAEDLRVQAEQRELERNARPISEQRSSGLPVGVQHQNHPASLSEATGEDSDGDVKPRRSYVYPNLENVVLDDGYLKRDIVS